MDFLKKKRKKKVYFGGYRFSVRPKKKSSFNNNNESIYKEQSLSVVAILSAYMHTNSCVQRCPHTSILTIQSLIYAQLKWAANRDLRQMKTAARNRKHGYSFQNEMF